MTIQLPGGRGAIPGGTPYEANPPDADWNSPLWEQPETVAAPWHRAPDDPAPPPPALPTQQRPRRRSRALLASAAVVLLLVGLGGAVLVDGALTSDSTSTAAGPRPTLPAPPSPVPSPPSLAPPGEGQGNQAGPQSPTENEAAAAVSPGLVDVVSYIGYDGAQGAGTGVVLTADGIVLTNHHVVAGSTSISVTDIGNGQTYKAKVLGYDRSHDVAVIKLSGASGLQTAPLGNSSTVSVGDSVVAIGNALGKGGAPTAVAGTVTGLNKSIAAQDSSTGTSEQLSGLIQVDAPIQPGDSGGALANANGKVIGIVTAAAESGSPDQTATAGFAIPIATAHSIADRIVAGRPSSTVHIGGTAFLGLQVDGSANGTSGSGLLVAGTVNGSAAADAGIVAGDVVTAVGGRSVATPDALKSMLDGKRSGDTITVGWTDQTGTSHTAKVTLTDGPTG